MAEQESKSGLHIDSDWKSEAAKEKEELAEKEAQQPLGRGAGGAGAPEANLLEIVNLLAMQAVVALGGYQGPGGERIAPNPFAARHFIDLLDVLQKKTVGNASEEEAQTLEAVLYELRMQFVQIANAAAASPPSPSSSPRHG